MITLVKTMVDERKQILEILAISGVESLHFDFCRKLVSGGN